MRRQPDGSVHAVARGRQRLLIHTASLESGAASLLATPVTPLPEGSTCAVPRPVREGAAWWGAWAAKPWDLQRLAARVAQLVRVVLAPDAG
jgi:hypothetical protein